MSDTNPKDAYDKPPSANSSAPDLPATNKPDRNEKTEFDAASENNEPTSRELESNQNGRQAAEPEQTRKDPNMVTFEGPNDPLNPKAWTLKRKWISTMLVSLITFMTPIASSMIAPAQGKIKQDLNVPSTIDSELIFSIFLLAFVIGPLFLAPLSEIYGRIVVLQLANIWFLIFNLVCGFAQTTPQMIVFRFLSGLGASAPQTIGGGVLSDLWSTEERGKAVAIYSLAPVLGPSAGPLMGAWITERTTWRWCFWAVTIFGVTVQILIYFTMPETFAPRILHNKAKKLRKETGNPHLHSEYESEDRKIVPVLKKASTRVVAMIGTQPIVQFLCLYMALNYGIIYLTLSTFPDVWSKIYHESIGIGGLNYIALLIGLTVGAQVSGRLVDLLYQRLKKTSSDGEGRPEFRVPPLFISTSLIAGGLFMFGWGAQYRVQWAVPDIGIAIFGAGTSMTITSLQAYTIDAYPFYAASAIGATAVARSLTGFAFPLFADQMFDALGEGWGNSLLAFCTLVVGYGGSLTLWFFGHRLRARSQYAKDPT